MSPEDPPVAAPPDSAVIPPEAVPPFSDGPAPPSPRWKASTPALHATVNTPQSANQCTDPTSDHRTLASIPKSFRQRRGYAREQSLAVRPDWDGPLLKAAQTCERFAKMSREGSASVALREEIRMPDEPARFVQHQPVDVLMTLSTSVGEEKTVLAGRCTTPHLRPNGAIVVVRPPLDATRSPPLKRADPVRARFRKSGETLEARGSVSWVRPKAFLPSGLSVSLVGVTFDGDSEAMELEVAAFLGTADVPPSSRNKR
jgi:hypothetical protein